VILLISASQVAGITGMSHWLLAVNGDLEKLYLLLERDHGLPDDPWRVCSA
jgi:hypothetical protein